MGLLQAQEKFVGSLLGSTTPALALRPRITRPCRTVRKRASRHIEQRTEELHAVLRSARPARQATLLSSNGASIGYVSKVGRPP